LEILQDVVIVVEVIITSLVEVQGPWALPEITITSLGFLQD
jgi:hypothetical protein